MYIYMVGRRRVSTWGREIQSNMGNSIKHTSEAHNQENCGVHAAKPVGEADVSCAVILV